jgi:serine-type D-Ala-D-Ala carboxypeptidase (penicillin-binding protein 5/6)
VLVLLAVALVRRIATESIPAIVLRTTAASFVRIPGRPPPLAWPGEGQAAVEVEGIGSFGSSGGSTPVPIASIAKVMTAYLTLLEHPLASGEQGFTMTVTLADVEEQGQRVALGESTVPVRVGERITERQALQALLLPSANNIAALLAGEDAGRVPTFVAHMNATARRLGMTSTTYTDPSGFNQRTVSTAADQLKLARVAMRIPAFAAIVEQTSAVIPVAGRITNYNGLLGAEGYVGIKTGSDSAAGGCLMFAKRVAIGGRRLSVLGVVLGQREGPLIESALSSAQRLGDSAAAALRVETVLPSGSTVLRATNANGQSTTAVTRATLRQIGWGGVRLPLQLLARTRLIKLHGGQRVAAVAVGGAGIERVDAVAKGSLGEPSLSWRLRHLF